MKYSEFHKNLNKTFLIIGFLLLFASCNRDTPGGLDEIASLHPAPQIVPLNTQEGYSINPFTGDSIQPIINSLGETVVTGRPVPASGKVIDPQSVAKPKVIPAGKPNAIHIQQTIHKIPETLTVVPVNESSLRTFTPGVDTSSFVLVQFGDTIPTGVPIPAIGKVVPCLQPQPVRALPPLMKDNASMNIKYLDVAQGMISTSVTCILQDSRGNIWIGTQGRGMSVYNGETFTHFTQNEGLSSNWITSILEDPHDTIWNGTLRGGVSMYNGEIVTHFTQKEGLISNNVNSILEDNHGNIWIGTDEGVSKYDGESFTHYTRKEGLNSIAVHCILEDSHGNFWFGTWGGGLSMYNGSTFLHLTQKDGLSSDRINSLMEDNRGNIWIGTDEGVCKYNGVSFTHFTEKEGLSNNHIRSLIEDSNGNLWFGTHGGVSMYNGKTFKDFTPNQGLSAYRVRSIMEDSQGNLWFGTELGGVSIYYGKTFTHVTLTEVLSERGIGHIFGDSQGNLWTASWGGGASMYNGESMLHYSQETGLISNIVRCILEDSHGNLWFGTIEGLCKYDGETFTHFTKKEGLSSDDIESMLEDSHGNLWFGTNGGGLNMYNGSTFMHLAQKDGLISDQINSLLEDNRGNIWIGTDKGMSKYNGESFTHFTEKEGLSNNHIKSMLEDKHDNLWFGTSGGGVSMFDGKFFTHFTQKEGLSDNYIASMLEDSTNSIWIGTRYGLNRLAFEPEFDSATIKGVSSCIPVIHTYGLQDGLKGISFIGNSVLLDREMRIWWTTYKGLTMLDINDLKPPAEPPVMQLNRIDIKGQFADYRHLDSSQKTKMEFNGVAKFYNYPLNLVLPHNRNNITLHFSAIDWSASQNLKYSYIMEGLDDQWNTPTAEASVEYRNIPQGRYTFKVRALGAAQKWSEAFEYSFRVLPPFWLKWWAYLIYGFLLLLLIRWYRGFLIKREKINADLRIKEVEVNKMQELDHMKSRFFANISHEFRTPLTLIQGPIEELRKQFQGKPEGSMQLFKTVKRSTQRLQDLINQLLDISKLETGNVKLQVSMGNLVELVKAIVLSFLSLAEYKKIKYEYDLPEEGEMVYFEPDKIEKILTNLISNAFKFTIKGESIHIGIRFLEVSPDNTQDTVEIKVSDTGKGIPSEKLSKIFDRFYQVGDQDSRETEGTGLGLALTKELVELYRGKISVESKEGKGSTFTVHLPVSEEQFREEEIVTTSSDVDLRTEPVMPDLKYEDSEETESVGDGIPEPAKNNYEILIVEDNDDLRKYISRNLDSSYRIIFAENGRIGLEKAYEIIPDLVISDVMMPEMDGMEMCKRLKTDERTDHIPVIMLTARADRSSRLEGLETGADDYLVKPFDTWELKVRVKNLLEQRRKLREKFRLEFLSDPSEMGLPPKNQFMKRLFDTFDFHLSDPNFKINQLSTELNLSLSQVQRKVMAITGYTPSELLRNHRLKKAASLFRGGYDQVAQVMHRVGFNNQSYFTKCFSELFKITPSQYIASYK